MSYRDGLRELVPNGLVCTMAAKTFARYGHWPSDFVAIVRKHHQGRIPVHVHALVQQMTSTRPWDRCAHGVDLTTDYPYCEACT